MSKTLDFRCAQLLNSVILVISMRQIYWENDIDQCAHPFFIEITNFTNSNVKNTGFLLRAIIEISNLSDFNKENSLKSVISIIFCPFLVYLCEEWGPNGYGFPSSHWCVQLLLKKKKYRKTYSLSFLPIILKRSTFAGKMLLKLPKLLISIMRIIEFSNFKSPRL